MEKDPKGRRQASVFPFLFLCFCTVSSNDYVSFLAPATVDHASFYALEIVPPLSDSSSVEKVAGNCSFGCLTILCLVSLLFYYIYDQLPKLKLLLFKDLGWFLFLHPDTGKIGLDGFQHPF